ncbi:M1-specific T cell receptor alpha chain-like isoform X3 [Bufo bufo]|uniref:M1-specific T cell receptor alpha chain-like isoform X3 n=1 Tax=Bufo bufo TaxID=8384 RepID=UPI001ABEC3BD|nr:M1-specific T cell receptor alpha chain-like isoform X3 [Bufo bufo]
MSTWNMLFFKAIIIFSLCSSCTCNIVQIARQDGVAGEDVNLSCDHAAITSSDYIHWYRVFPGQGPVFLISGFRDNELEDYKITFGKDRKSSILSIRDVKPEDSAVYLCAQSCGSNEKRIFGRGTRLSVTPKTDRTSPSVYQLTSYKPTESLPNTVCLVTDFPSPNKTLDVDKQEIELNDIAVLDKSSSDVWRYSAVIWDQDNPSKDLSCAVKYDGETVHPDTIIDETTDTCSSLSVTKRFHTNPSMNTLSTSVLGLRILTAKAVVFNLMINLRLWSS